MYSKRQFRLLFVVVVFIIAISLVLIKGEGIIDLEKYPSKVKPPSGINEGKTSFLDKLPFMNKPEGEPPAFPLSDFLIKKELYKQEKLTVFTDPFVVINGNALPDSEGDDVDTGKACDALKMEGNIDISDVKLLEADFDTIQEQIKKNEQYHKLLEKANEKFKPKVPLENQWLRFAGSSVWLETYEVHYMVSRLIYSPSGIPNKGFASFLYVQIFDRDWNELSTSLNLPYEQDTVQNVMNSDGSINEVVVDKKLAYREVSFPSLLPIAFDYILQTADDKYYFGPEDPRILKRKNPKFGFEEPIVVFNMKDLTIVKRVMHSYLPFSGKLKRLSKRSVEYANIEKNWTPFISPRSDQQDKLNFVYSIIPLEVVSCEIQTGICDFIQKADKEDTDKYGDLRGGSQLERLPIETLPTHIQALFSLPANREIYIGWARTHLSECGCGESMYRPNLIILIEDYNPETKKYYYKIGDVSDFVDFNAEIPPWVIPKFDDEGKLITDNNPPACDKSLRNVLIPNSIAYWEVESLVQNSVLYQKKFFNKINDPKEDKPSVLFNDYMGVTLSAADSDVSVVHIKGLLNFILDIESLYDHSTVITMDSIFNQKGSGLNEQCSEIAAKEYCVKYAEANGGVQTY